MTPGRASPGLSFPAVSWGPVESSFAEHFQRPRGVGELDDATVRVEVENPVCGDRMRLSLRVDGERVVAAAWEVRGCSGAVAAASALWELLQGATLAAAERLDRAAVEAALGGMPPHKRHGADLAVDALEEALEALPRAGGETS